MKTKKQSLVLALILIFIILLSTTSLAAQGSFSISKTSASLTEGESTTFSINTLNCEGKFIISSSDPNVVKVSSSAEWVDNSGKEIKLTAVKAGTAKITITADDVGDTSENPVTGSKTISVTVKEKNNSDENSTSEETSSSGSSSENTKPKTPKFTTVNETVYATTEVNVRKSYSTSSAIVGSLEKGESVKRTGIGDNGWSKVTYNGQTAYISSTYLTKTKPVVEEPKEEPEDTNITANENNENNEINTNTNNTDNNNTTDNKTQINSQNLQLSKLEISGVNFSEGFNPEIYTYELKLNFFVKDLNITAVANKEDAKIEIIGNENFKEGENNINILVSSADGNETVTYQIKVIVPSEVENNPQNNLQFYLICGIIILAAIAAMIVVIAIYKQKNKKEYDDEEEDFYKFKIDEQYNNEEKPKKTKGKHSN